ncbi:hypothetical protein TD95_000289 [Thielaviopsis punctulata]|uniref:Uncharacterized protein n=1 Tax=Thielaviopsis punctulata TaxID=72032 RepID=A0A0F4ZFE3_9PEZI|nr:hypothetical protein TD95_000289 [Thielaviopsis punctulata]
MQSLLTVNNSVTLLSINIAPSSFIAAFTLGLVFLYIYLISLARVPSPLPVLKTLGRLPFSAVSAISSASSWPSIAASDKKELPASQHHQHQHKQLPPTTTSLSSDCYRHFNTANPDDYEYEYSISDDGNYPQEHSNYSNRIYPHATSHHRSHRSDLIDIDSFSQKSLASSIASTNDPPLHHQPYYLQAGFSSDLHLATQSQLAQLAQRRAAAQILDASPRDKQRRKHSSSSSVGAGGGQFSPHSRSRSREGSQQRPGHGHGPSHSHSRSHSSHNSYYYYNNNNNNSSSSSSSNSSSNHDRRSATSFFRFAWDREKEEKREREREKERDRRIEVSEQDQDQDQEQDRDQDQEPEIDQESEAVTRSERSLFLGFEPPPPGRLTGLFSPNQSPRPLRLPAPLGSLPGQELPPDSAFLRPNQSTRTASPRTHQPLSHLTNNHNNIINNNNNFRSPKGGRFMNYSPRTTQSPNRPELLAVQRAASVMQAQGSDGGSLAAGRRSKVPRNASEFEHHYSKENRLSLSPTRELDLDVNEFIANRSNKMQSHIPTPAQSQNQNMQKFRACTPSPYSASGFSRHQQSPSPKSISRNKTAGKFSSRSRRQASAQSDSAQYMTPPPSQENLQVPFSENEFYDVAQLRHLAPAAEIIRASPAPPPASKYRIKGSNQSLQPTVVVQEAPETPRLRDRAYAYVHAQFRYATSSTRRFACSLFAVLCFFSIASTLIQPVPLANRPPVPDLVKVAGVARSFAPLIYYSEGGAQRVTELQQTSHAVWDLGESVRDTNIPSATLIHEILETLSDDLNVLALEMSKFFARVDGDIDGILIVMEWARRELTSVQLLPQSPLAFVLDNFYLTFAGSGVFERSDGSQTALGAAITSVLGRTHSQRARQTLERTFHEFLGVLEGVVSRELERSVPLLSRFDSADSKFQTLAETVQRDDADADEGHRAMLASLWTKMLGPRAAMLRKFEQNKELLRDVRAKTQSNKYILVDHNAKLGALKASLEGIRKTLVSPLIRTVNSTSLTLNDQISGLEEVSAHLSSLRKEQRERLMQMLYGNGEPKLMIDEQQLG